MSPQELELANQLAGRGWRLHAYQLWLGRLYALYPMELPNTQPQGPFTLSHLQQVLQAPGWCLGSSTVDQLLELR